VPRARFFLLARRQLSEHRTALVVLFACLVCQMGLGLGGYIFAVFLKPVVADLGWSRTAFSWAGGPFLLAMALASPGVGALTERVGARVVFSCGIILVATALILFSYMETLWHFYAIGFLLGAATTGMGDIPAGAVVSKWFERNRGLALGLVYVGSNIGGSIVPIAATELTAIDSWRFALRVLAVGGLVVILPFAAWLVREPDASNTSDGSDSSDRPDESDRSLTLREAMRTRSFWILAGVLFLFYFYYVGINHHLVAFLSDSGFTDAEAARRFGYAVAIGIAGKIGMGLFADRIPIRAAIVVNFALMTTASFLLLFVGRAPMLLPVFLTIHGFTVAAENVVLPLVIVECFGVRHLARIYGVIMFVLLPGGTFGPVFAGHVFDTFGNYRIAFTTFAVLNVVAVLALLFLRPLGQNRIGVERNGSYPTES
jgi:sugar phosphate permease